MRLFQEVLLHTGSVSVGLLFSLNAGGQGEGGAAPWRDVRGLTSLFKRSFLTLSMLLITMFMRGSRESMSLGDVLPMPGTTHEEANVHLSLCGAHEGRFYRADGRIFTIECKQQCLLGLGQL